MRKFRNVNPFPRFGHAANASVGKEGEIYVFGGLVKEKRKSDLYVLDSGKLLCRCRWDDLTLLGSMTAYTINSTGEGPSPRLGHASLLVGNAFIGSHGAPLHFTDALVFGGECATTDLSHDDSLYLLNTSIPSPSIHQN